MAGEKLNGSPRTFSVNGGKPRSYRGKRRAPGKPLTKVDARINRKGAPKDALAFQKFVREKTVEALNGKSRLDATGESTRLDKILLSLVEKAEGGNLKAAEMIIDRVGGKPAQPAAAPASRGRAVRFVFDIPAPAREARPEEGK